MILPVLQMYKTPRLSGRFCFWLVRVDIGKRPARPH